MGPGRRPAVPAALVAVAVALLAGCGPVAPKPPASAPGSPPAATRDVTAATSAQQSTTAAPTCPAQYLPPRADRPELALSFTVAPDHASVTGTERVTFTPDLPISQLVFRLWPNSSSRFHGSLQITGAGVPGQAIPLDRLTYESLGGRAGTPGTLVRMPLPHPVAAGTTVSATLDFKLQLPGINWPDRIGHTPQLAWWASAHPMLAWVAGHGWAMDRDSPLPVETATSEAARTDVTVVAPASDSVVAGGRAEAPTSSGPGQKQWRFSGDAMRDVAVAVGHFTLTKDTLPSGVPVTEASSADAPAIDPAYDLAEVQRAATLFSQRFGPYPFESLVFVSLPGIGGTGIEFPGIVFYGGVGDIRDIVTHEVAHQWFYGLVGNDQASDPWLDEAMASFSETLINPASITGVTPADAAARLGELGSVGASVESFGTDLGGYFTTIYDKGAAALVVARQRTGSTAFDAALRCYINANAWRVASPASVAAAFAQLPQALQVLTQTGALPAEARPPGSHGS